MRKMGLARDIDLALHIPLRYEDETRIVKLSDAREGDAIQIEATVVSSEVQLRPRRQLLVTVDDGTDTCVLRFFSFYPAQQKALAVGQVIRARGEVKGGFMGFTMMHPAFRAATGDLPSVLTPVYPTSAGLPQTYLRRAIAGAHLFADEQHWRLVALALADHHDACDVQKIQLVAHGVDGGLIGGLFIAAPDQTGRGQRRRLGHTGKAQGQKTVLKFFLVGHDTAALPKPEVNTLCP